MTAQTQNPSDIESLYKKAFDLYSAGHYDEALEHFDALLAQEPGHARARQVQGVIYMKTGKSKQAEESFQRIIRDAPSYARAYGLLGKLYLILQRTEESKKIFEQGMAIDPEDPEIISGMAWHLKTGGQSQEAARLYHKAYDISRDPAYLFDLALQAHRFENADDPYLQSLHRLERESASVAKIQTDVLYNVLAKAYRDLGETDRAFEYLNKSAAATRKIISYDPQTSINMMQVIENYFSPALFKSFQLDSCKSDRPVFIVGMPRCGSTLVEQILFAHPDVDTIGESEFLGQLFQSRSYLPNYNGIDFLLPRKFEDLKNTLPPRTIGESYIKYLDERGTCCKRTVDKTLNHFLWIGMIHLCLPNAKIIHCRRNPLDLGLSCYEHLFFRRGVHYSYDLEELGRYYRAYDRLMQHWHDVLPGKILDVQYEDLVDDLEGQSQRIIDFIGLEWDESCLSFHEQKRSVVTASLEQVKRPIYKSSVGRWRKYEKHLAPLIRGLGPAAPQEALPILEKYG